MYVRTAWSCAAAIAATALLVSPCAAADRLKPISITNNSFDWRETARLEHEDRKNRFRRLAAAGLIAKPEFYDEIVSRQDLKAFGVDIPVLRLVFQPQEFFETDKSELRPEALRQLDAVAASLRRDVPDLALFVAGHADARGSDEYNYVLSVARADTVARYLFSRGVGLTKMWRVGFGKAVPLKPNTSPENMAVNRRVEFLFAAKPEAIAIWLSRQRNIVCPGASPAAMKDCLEKIEMLPAIIATPVLNDKVGSIEPIQTRSIAPAQERRDVVAATDRKVDVRPSDEKQIVAIEKNSTVIIDLREQKVTVGAPVL